MPDHDRFADFLPPGKGFEIPARVAMYQRLITLGTVMQDDFMRAIPTLPEYDQAEIAQRLDTMKDGSLRPMGAFHFKPELQPTKLQGADTIKFGYVFLPDDDNSPIPLDLQSRAVELDIALYKDGSPYVPDELFERGITRNEFTIAATPDPEQPPFIVNNGQLTIEKSPGVEDHISVEEYAAIKHAAGEDLVFLSDEECKDIVDAAARVELDIKGTAQSLGAIIDEPKERTA